MNCSPALLHGHSGSATLVDIDSALPTLSGICNRLIPAVRKAAAQAPTGCESSSAQFFSLRWESLCSEKVSIDVAHGRREQAVCSRL